MFRAPNSPKVTGRLGPATGQSRVAGTQCRRNLSAVSLQGSKFRAPHRLERPKRRYEVLASDGRASDDRADGRYAALRIAVRARLNGAGCAVSSKFSHVQIVAGTADGLWADGVSAVSAGPSMLPARVVSSP